MEQRFYALDVFRGAPLAFTMPYLGAAGNAMMWKKVIKRTVWIFCMGLFLNAFPFLIYNADGALELKAFQNLIKV